MLPLDRSAYAGFFARLAAALIDGFIVVLFLLPALAALLGGPRRTTTCDVDVEGNITDIGGEGASLCRVPTGATIAFAVILGLLALVGMVLYYTLQTGRTGQTIGKRALNIRVVDARTGQPIGNGRALGRYLFQQFISGTICYLGYLWCIWDERKQTWHDKVVDSVVVRT